MPDAGGRFKGISVPRIPWHEPKEPTKGAFIRAWDEEICLTNEAYGKKVVREYLKLTDGFAEEVAHEHPADERDRRQPDDPGHLGELARGQ